MVTDRPDVRDFSRFTFKQAAEILGVHRNTITNYTKSGRLPCNYRKNLRPFIYGRDIRALWDEKL